MKPEARRASDRLHPPLCRVRARLAFLSVPAVAGRACDGRAPGVTETQSALKLVRTAMHSTAAAQVAILARIGSDQSSRGVRYTHVGLVQRVRRAAG